MKKLSLRERRANNRLMNDKPMNESSDSVNEAKNKDVLMLDTAGHDKALMKRFKDIASNFSTYTLFELIVERYFDDKDLEGVISILEEQSMNEAKKYYVKVFHIDGLEQPIRNEASINGGQYLYSEMSISREMYAIVEFTNYADAEKFIKVMRGGKSRDGKYYDYETSKVLDRKPV